MLLDDEMRRAVQFCWHMATTWEKRQKAQLHTDIHVMEGIRAYAAEQVFVEKERARKWFTAWGPIRYRAKEVLKKKLGNVEEDMGDIQDILIPSAGDADYDDVYDEPEDADVCC
jgi:hypothetical protein